MNATAKETKACNKCKIEKLINEYYIKKTKIGTPYRNGICKECCRLSFREYANSHKEDAINKAKKWRTLNPEKYKENNEKYRAKWKIENPEKYKEERKRYYKKHRSEILEKSRKRYRENPYKVYIRDNSEEIKEKKRAWFKKWYKENKKEHKKRAQKYYIEHKNQCKIAQRKWNKNNPNKLCLYRTRRIGTEKFIESRRRQAKRKQEELRECYVRSILLKKGFKRKYINTELIEFQRILTKLKREVKNGTYN